MSQGTESYHSSCQFCDTNFLGFTDADMVQHIAEHHPGKLEEIRDWVGINSKHLEVCQNCGKEYVTYNGACPFCHHGGGPYK